MTTKFQCKLCGKNIVVDLEDSKTYIQKTTIENELLGNLYSYRISHQADENIKHINVIIVDKQGDYRAHRDSYEEKVESDSDLVQKWAFYSSFFPYELHSYLVLASNDLKKALVEQDLPEDVNAPAFLDYLKLLVTNNPQFDLLHFLAAKWAYITADTNYINEIVTSPPSWAHIIVIGFGKLEPDISKQTEDVDKLETFFEDLPAVIDAEIVHTKAWFYNRTNNFEKLKDLYLSISEKWKDKLDLSYKTVFHIVGSLYAFQLQIRGNVSEALKIIEPAFNYAQLIGDRKMIVVVGNLYGGVLRPAGNVEKAFTIYNNAKGVAEEINDQRTLSAIIGNLAIIDVLEGRLTAALEKFLSLLELPVIDENPSYKYGAYINIAVVYNRLKQYDKAIEFAKKIIEDRPPMAITAYAFPVLIIISRKTKDTELIQYVLENISEDGFFETARGKFIKIDIQATLAELDENWDKMIEDLHNALDLAINESIFEEVIGVEIRLAEAYLIKYKHTNNIEHLNNCYKQLDLARDLALESHYYPELVQLTLLKGILAAQAGSSERAEKILTEALEIAKKQNLVVLTEEATSTLDSLYKGSLGTTDSSSLKLFNKLKDFTPTTPTKQKPKSIVEIVWVSSQTYHWEFMLKTSEQIEQTALGYMYCLRDLWKYAKKDIEKQGININHGKYMLLIEQSTNFTIIALSTKTSYQVRSQIEEILQKMENFTMKHITEESIALVTELCIKNWNDVTKIDI